MGGSRLGAFLQVRRPKSQLMNEEQMSLRQQCHGPSWPVTEHHVTCGNPVIDSRQLSSRVISKPWDKRGAIK